MLFDANEKTEGHQHFISAWNELYPGKIEVSFSSTISQLAKTHLQIAGEKVSGDVLNVIPPQRASELTHKLALTDDSGWCPVKAGSFESTKVKNIHIIGDAINSEYGFSKTAQAANAQAKICAIAISKLLVNADPLTDLPPLIDSEYSMLAPDYAISSTKIFRFNSDGNVALVSSGSSSVKAPAKQRKREVLYAYSWFNNITNEMFG